LDMDDAILYMSDELKLKAFELNWAKLEASTTHLNIDTVGLCVRLLPALSDESRKSHDKLRHLLVDRIRNDEQDSQCLYHLAEACTHNASFAELFYASIHQALLDAAPWAHPFTQKPAAELEVSAGERVRQVVAFITFLKCSYWLPSGSLHVVRPGILRILMSCVEQEGLAEPALDALSALLALSGSKASIQVPTFEPFGSGAVWAKLDSLAGRYTLDGSLIYLSFWSHLKTLSPALFETKASKLYKVWFQWISQMVKEGIHPDDGGLLYGNVYWDRVRTGLLTGFADQRKYCLGIIRASLLVAQWDIDTFIMRMEADNRETYIKAYGRYFVLYETIVLDRYANQIEACLSELSALFGPQSVVTASMATTLLSSGLDPQVQDGIRKIIGNWYFSFMSGAQSPLSKDRESLTEHTKFLVSGFLPWATQGTLFTATLKATRTSTECNHGAALVKLVARFVTSKFADEQYYEQLLVSTLKFVLDAGGKMFQMSTLYLLEGLIAGFDTVTSNGGEFSAMSRSQVA
jgi:tRNA guanosine-2'-O-methyltransferase